MSLDLGTKAQIRTTAFVAAEPIPFFWPMRAFIHHNPLHGLEKLHFEEAVDIGKRLFHGDGFLTRTAYQRYLDEGKIDQHALSSSIEDFLKKQPSVSDIDLRLWLMKLLTETEKPIAVASCMTTTENIAASIQDNHQSDTLKFDSEILTNSLCESLLKGRPIYEIQDLLFGTGIGEELDDLVIKSCLDFFDEGQSVWRMPYRDKGFFSAWREVALRNARLFLRGHNIREILKSDPEPEGIIAHAMERLKIPEERWMDYFRCELSRLHGWAGFIRWRSTARHYYQSRAFPGDLVDFLAVRLTLSLALMDERNNEAIPSDAEQLEQYIMGNPTEAFLRQEFYGKSVIPAWAHKVEKTLLSRDRSRIEKLGQPYIDEKCSRDTIKIAESLQSLAAKSDQSDALKNLDKGSLSDLISIITSFEKHEGMIWLEAMESAATKNLLSKVNLTPPENETKRPFAQALFCIDTRSERLRRHLENVGDYQTFGIAGFFGVPVSFMELGKGSETHLCPVLLTPKNLVMEMSVDEVKDTVAITAMEKALHELKESVLTPFVTVEAIGLLFGFDMVGKTIAPTTYNSWRSHLHEHKPHTHLLIDKLSREQADSIVRAVQRAVIAKAVENEFEVSPEDVTDDLVRELREVALGHSKMATLLMRQVNIDSEQSSVFVKRLRKVYRINQADSRLQMERLGRIGFSLDEQVMFVSQALYAIGLTDNFSRFILVVGHGSQSENNPYESALDCGACGGNLGLYNARIFANMANKPAVRKRLKTQGISIPDDAWFIPAMHNTTTDEVSMHDLTLLPSTHPIYLDRLQNGLLAACRLCTQERLPSLDFISESPNIIDADKLALRNAMDWSQVRPEWGLSRNAYFIIGRRALTESSSLDGRAFLHSYDYRVDGKFRLLENILTGPLVVGQWINMEHYFSTVDNEHYGSGSKVYHNVAGRFGVMTGNQSDLRTGLPAQTVLADGEPFHEPMRLITVIEAPFDHVNSAINRVSGVRRLINNGWIRLLIIDPESGKTLLFDKNQWLEQTVPTQTDT